MVEWLPFCSTKTICVGWGQVQERSLRPPVLTLRARVAEPAPQLQQHKPRLLLALRRAMRRICMRLPVCSATSLSIQSTLFVCPR